MATNPPNDDPPSNPAPQPVQAPVNEAQATPESPKEISPQSVFVNSEPIREDQVQNAVKFLSHPRVRGSPVVHRRNFLEKKGLTKEEIDEAFRRVPDPSSTVAGGQTSTYPDTTATNASNIQTQAPVQAMQPIAAAPSGALSTMRKRFHWSHAVLAVGYLALCGAGTAIVFKKTIIPRFKSWIRRVVLDEENAIEPRTGKPSLAEEAVAAAKAAAVSAADGYKNNQEMLITKNEVNKCFAEFTSLMDVQLQEIRTMRNSISRLEVQLYGGGKNPVREEYLDGSVTRSTQLDGKFGFDKQSVRSSTPPPSTEPPHSKSYMEIMSMVQRGEKPPNVRDIDDRPPNPNQPISNPSQVPRVKPWEATQTAGNPNFVPQRQVTTTEGATYTTQDNGVSYQFNDDTSAPWWQKRNGRITEIENGDGSNFASGSGSSGTINIDHPAQRKWVPPQPPPVSMPEAAIAIRQPKSVPKDVNTITDMAAQPVNEVDELQKITRISESGGGQLETNGGSEIEEVATEM